MKQDWKARAEQANTEMRFLVAGDVIEYRKKKMFQTLFDQKSQDDSLQLVSMIESIDPGDHIMTITLKNGSHFCGTDEEYELRKIEDGGETNTCWGDIESYHLEKSTLEKIERRGRKKRKKADEKKKSNDAAAEKLLRELQQKYAKHKGKKKV